MSEALSAVAPAANAPANINVTPEGAPPPAAAPAANDWTTGLNDDMKGWVQNKGYKDVYTALDAHRNLEKLLGAPKERLLKLPEKDDAPEWGDVFKRLGTPEKPEDYNLKFHEAADGTWAKQAFHEAGLTAKQAAKLAEKWNGYLENSVKGQQEAYQQKITQEEASLKKEWGAAHDENIQKAQIAAKTLGIQPEQIDALEKTLGYAGVMKFMNGLGAKLGEDAFVGSGSKGSFNAMTPEAAQNQIQALKGDPSFVQKYIAGDASARAELEKLHKFAYPE